MYMHVYLDLTSFPNVGLIADALLHWPLLSANVKSKSCDCNEHNACIIIPN